jgi:hypothetical protein
MRYRAIYSTMASGGRIEWSATDDAAALADAQLWADQYDHGYLVRLTTAVTGEPERQVYPTVPAPHRYVAERAGWRTCAVCGQGANAHIHTTGEPS